MLRPLSALCHRHIQLPSRWRRRNVSSARTSYNLSFSPFAAVNATFFEAAILIASPVAGLRPSRSGRSLTVNLPNPGIVTSSSFTAAAAIWSNRAV